MRQVVIYPGEDGYWVAECPTLPGCISQGKTKEEAVQNIREAIDAYVAALEEDGLSIPRVTYDSEVDALYIRFIETTVTTKHLAEDIAADYDAEGRLAGIEILDAVKRFDILNNAAKIESR
jgi:predicted RNase H-like HicB family nuclease